jgi:hypothetical protein
MITKDYEQLSNSEQFKAYTIYCKNFKGEKNCPTILDFFDYAVECCICFCPDTLQIVECLISWNEYIGAVCEENIDYMAEMVKNGYWDISDCGEHAKAVEKKLINQPVYN